MNPRVGSSVSIQLMVGYHTSVQDSREKLALFIDSTVKTREAFSFAHPNEQIKAMEKYCLSFYGCSLWRLEDSLDRICASWRTTQKLAWNVHCGCHSYFLDHVLCPTTVSLKECVLSRTQDFSRVC